MTARSCSTASTVQPHELVDPGLACNKMLQRKLSIPTVLTIIQFFAHPLCVPTHFAVVKGLKLFDCDYNPPGFD